MDFSAFTGLRPADVRRCLARVARPDALAPCAGRSRWPCASWWPACQVAARPALGVPARRSVHAIGAAEATSHVTLWVHDARFLVDFLLRGDLGAGEAVHAWRLEHRRLADVHRVGRAERDGRGPRHVDDETRQRAQHRAALVPRQHAEREPPEHRGALRSLNELFALFLDETMIVLVGDVRVDQTSRSPRRSAASSIALCDRLALCPDDHVLEIGCGWGGFAIHAAQTRGCRVTGITISPQQFESPRAAYLTRG